MKQTQLLILLIILSIGMIACGSTLTDDQAGTENPTDTAQDEQVNDLNGTDDLAGNDSEQQDEQTPDLAEEIEATLEIEGMEEPTTLQLYQNEAADFSVYLPEDMIGQFNGAHFNSYTNYLDQKNENARLFITAETKQAVRAELEGDGFKLNETDSFSFDFSDEEFNLEKQGFIGRVSFFTSNDQAYSIGYYYPEEFADGFSARSALIIENIRWHD